MEEARQIDNKIRYDIGQELHLYRRREGTEQRERYSKVKEKRSDSRCSHLKRS